MNLYKLISKKISKVFSDHPKDLGDEIPICGDCWLEVFDLVAPRQLGLEIALLSHRFDYYVDQHFRTRKWTFGLIKIRRHKIKQKIHRGTKTKMQIFNSKNELLPMPKKELPTKVVGFRAINIYYMDKKVADFLLHFRCLFTTYGISLTLDNPNDHVVEFIVHNIWPILKNKNTCQCFETGTMFNRLRHFVPSLLSDLRSLRVIVSNDMTFPEFPADDSANASDGQALAKWLLMPRPDGVPKVLKCEAMDWETKIAGIKTDFVDASTPVSFVLWDINSPNDNYSAGETILELTNNLTAERLVLKRQDKKEDKEHDSYYLCRCPILRDEKQWIKWEKETTEWLDLKFSEEHQWDKIGFYVEE